MINFQALRLMHHHGGDDYSPMSERDHDAAGHDPERSWIHGARIFKCDSCSDEVIVIPPADEPGNTRIE